MRETDSFFIDQIPLYSEIIVYGAGRFGELAFFGLKELGVTPSFFVDRKLSGGSFLGVNVINPEDLRSHPDAAVLIASVSYFREMLGYLKSIGHVHIFDISELINLDYDDSVLSEYARNEKNGFNNYLDVIEHVSGDELVINHVDLVITECCTLKCRDCSNLMPFFNDPEIYDIEDVSICFDRFLHSIDCLLELRILGGEPFIHPGLGALIDRYAHHEKIRHIRVCTNSTVIPRDDVLRSLRNDSVSVHLSDYGTPRSRVEELVGIFRSRGIDYTVQVYDNWFDLGGIEKRGYDTDTLKALYDNCYMSRCLSFYRGRLYTCPRNGHGDRLGLFAVPDHEYVDFNGMKSDDQRAHIIALLENLSYVTACDYCDGACPGSKQVHAAIQIDVTDNGI